MIQRYVRLSLLAVAVGLFVTAALISPAHVTAVRVTAIAKSTLTAQDCSTGKSFLVSFSWGGKTVTETDSSPTCGHGVLQGAPVTVYVASNDPSNVGPDANWILNPDTHDPFDFIGPNGLRGFTSTVGVLTFAAPLVWYLADYRARRRAATAR